MKRPTQTLLLSPRGLVAGLLCFGLAGLFVIAGCSNTNKGLKGGDPILGEPALPKGGVPGMPTSLDKRPKGSTPASLVNHTDVPGLSGARPLTLDPSAPRDASGRPIPAKVVPLPREKPGGLLPTGAWSADPAGIADPIKRLEALGALGVRQKAVPGGVHLTCYIEGGATPDSLRLLEATGADLAIAAEALAAQIRK